MKKIVALLLVLVLSIGVALADVDLSGYTDEELRELRSKIDAELVSRQTARNASGEVLLEGDFDGCHVIMDRIFLSKDYKDRPCFCMHFIFSNPSSKEKSFGFTIFPTLFQNGIELDSGIMVEGCDSDNYLKEIKDGAQIEVSTGYVLQDTSSPVEVTIKELFGGTPVVGTFAVPE